MRDFRTFIGGVAVVIWDLTGVFATEEENKPRSIDGGGEEMDELEDEIDEEADDSCALCN